jgi:hypothetical protein
MTLVYPRGKATLVQMPRPDLCTPGRRRQKCQRQPGEELQAVSLSEAFGDSASLHQCLAAKEMGAKDNTSAGHHLNRRSGVGAWPGARISVCRPASPTGPSSCPAASVAAPRRLSSQVPRPKRSCDSPVVAIGCCHHEKGFRPVLVMAAIALLANRERHGASSLSAALTADMAAGLAPPHDPTAVGDEVRRQLSHASPAVRDVLRRLPPLRPHNSYFTGPVVS